jgi:hypothetical protein
MFWANIHNHLFNLQNNICGKVIEKYLNIMINKLLSCLLKE